MKRYNDYHQELILILDFGSQYTQLIARKVRELGVYCEIYPYNHSMDAMKAMNPRGIILSGGPASINEKNAPLCDKGVFDLGVPVLGICYGLQLLSRVFGGKVEKAPKREFGKAHLYVGTKDKFLDGIKDGDIVWMSHSDKVLTMPRGFVTLARSDN